MKSVRIASAIAGLSIAALSIAASHSGLQPVAAAASGKDSPRRPRRRSDEPPDVPVHAERRPKERRRIQKLWGKRP